MPDITLICANCNNEFVFSAGEQDFYAGKSLTPPKYCPICRSIKAQEKKVPPKPSFSVPANQPESPKKA